jgi:hypothetical protein
MTQRIDKDDQLWLVCAHVREGKAAEAWCRPDRVAVCPHCAAEPDGIPDEGLSFMCPACLIEAARRIALVRGREYLERDGIVGHIGHN